MVQPLAWFRPSLRDIRRYLARAEPGLPTAATPGTILIDIGTTAVFDTTKFAGTADPTGMRRLDPPVSGGRVGAMAASTTARHTGCPATPDARGAAVAAGGPGAAPGAVANPDPVRRPDQSNFGLVDAWPNARRLSLQQAIGP